MDEFDIPEDITALDEAALAAAVEAATTEQAAFAAMADEDFTDEQIERFEAITAFIASAAAEVESRASAASARQDRLAAARAAATPAEAPAEGAESGSEPPAVVAAARPVRPTALSALGQPGAQAQAAEPQGAAEPAFSIIAGANVPGLSLSQSIDGHELATAAMEQFRRMPKGRMGIAHQEFALAQIKRNRTDGFSTENRDYETVDALLSAAADESRLEGGSLVAAGGWCAPSETMYDVYLEGTAEGLWDLPSTNWARGGINFTRGPQFADFYAQTEGHWWLTEAQVEAGTEKSFIEIDCPDFTEVRLDAVGVGIKVPFLTEAAYPEYVQNFIQGTLLAQQHRVSATLIQKALTIAGAATAFGNIWPTAVSLLTALELVVESERQRYRLARNATLEAIFPVWVLPLLRADLSMRTGVDMLNITNETLVAHFRARGVNPQFVYNWQALSLSGTGGVGPATDFPATLEVLLYPAGTFVKGTNDIVDLRTVYDLPTLKTNAYTGLFAEEGVGLAWRRFRPQRISLTLPATGRTAAADVSQDWGTAPVAP